MKVFKFNKEENVFIEDEDKKQVCKNCILPQHCPFRNFNNEYCPTFEKRYKDFYKKNKEG